MNYLEMGRLSLNEGLFKDVEQTLIDQDDPDYIRKDRERMFTSFKDADIRTQDHHKIVEWIQNNLYCYDYRSASSQTGGVNRRYVNESDEGTLFTISGNSIDDMVIDLFEKKIKYLIKPADPEEFKLIRKLPYKFRKCEGSFLIDSDIASDLKFLTSFENVPTEIGENLIIRLTITGLAFWPNLSTLPAGIHIENNLQLHGSGIVFDHLPDNITVGHMLQVGYNDYVADLKWWNPTSSAKELNVVYCKSFKSLSGLPNGIEFDYLGLSKNNIWKIDNWPSGLKVNGIIDLEENYLSVESLNETPLPADLNARCLIIGKQYDANRTWSSKPKFMKKSKRNPIPIPAGVSDFFIWKSANGSSGEATSDENIGYWKRMNLPAVNEGAFKSVEQTLIDQDDPDYIEKDRERMFNQFKEADIKKKKDAIAEWISDNVCVPGRSGFYEKLTPEMMARHKKEWEYTGEPPFYYIDDDFAIHFPNPTVTYAIGEFGQNDVKSIPYKIAECAGSLYASEIGLTSFKNFPYQVGGTLDISNNPDLHSCTGCPQIIGSNFIADRCGLKTLEGGPVLVGHIYSVRDNKLETLTGLPRKIYGDLYINYNCLKSLGDLSDLWMKSDRTIFVANNLLSDKEILRIDSNYRGKFNFYGLRHQQHQQGMDYMSLQSLQLNLNEGAFKDVEQTLIDQDDPDYIEKDRERMFNSFVQSDKEKLTNKIIEWLDDHLYVRLYGGDNQTGFQESIKWYKWMGDQSGAKVKDLYTINDDCTISLIYPEAEYTLFLPEGTKCLPYKFKFCAGRFSAQVRSGTSRGLRRYNDDSFTSLINYPDTVLGGLIISKKPNLKSLEGFPKVVKGQVCIYKCGITSLKGCATEITGDFMLGNCDDLTTLEGGPTVVHGDYYISSLKQLKSFKGCPREVKNFFSSNNRGIDTTKYISPIIHESIAITANSIKKLEDMPENFSGDINLNDNCLTSLEGSPSIIGGGFDVGKNKLVTLKGCPKSIGDGDGKGFLKKFFNIDDNYLTKIDYFPESFDPAYFKMCAIHNMLDHNAYLDFVDKFLKQKNIAPETIINTKKGTRRLAGTFGDQSWNKLSDTGIQSWESDSSLSLNEGAFKDIEKTIIDQDDPDYIEKDRERMFNQFKEADEKKHKEALEMIERWVYRHVRLGHVNGFHNYAIKPEDKGKYFYIDDSMRIHLCFTDYAVNYVICKDTINGEDKPFELPYKIVECTGGLHFENDTLTSCKNFPDTVRTDLLCQYQRSLTTLKDLPKSLTVGGQCSFNTCGLTSLEDMPETLAVGRELVLNHNNLSVSDLEILQDRLIMGDNFGGIYISGNPKIKIKNVDSSEKLTKSFKNRLVCMY